VRDISLLTLRSTILRFFVIQNQGPANRMLEAKERRKKREKIKEKIKEKKKARKVEEESFLKI